MLDGAKAWGQRSRRRLCFSDVHKWLCFVLLFVGSTATRTLKTTEEETQQDEGFLSNELPLRIVVTTPSDLTSKDILRVPGNQALTVVFSRPVIALGQDFGKRLPDDKIPFIFEPSIPGRLQWVSTYIARWDAEGMWPFDSEINFKINDELKTHDGVFLNTTGMVGSSTIITPSLSMDLTRVTSKKANKFTDNRWNPYIGIKGDILPEVPPDGVMELSFNYNVSLSVLGKKLQVLDEGKKAVSGLKINVAPCESAVINCKGCSLKKARTSFEEDSCAAVTIDGNLGIQTRYTLFLPKGTKYSEDAGPLTEGKEVSFGGLRKFRIPLPHSLRISSRHLLIHLPHGLERTDKTGLKALKKHFELLSNKKKIDFDLSLLDKGTLELVAPLEPSQDYRIFAGIGLKEVRDGFGLPLNPSNQTFSTRSITGAFGPITAPGQMIFEAKEDWGQKLVAAYVGRTPQHSGCEGVEPGAVNAYRVFGDRPIRSALASLLYTRPKMSIANRFKSSTRTIQRKGNDTSGEMSDVNISPILKPHGVVIFEHCTSRFFWNHIETNMVTETNLQVSAIGSSVGSSLVFITSMSTGKPVEGVKVSLIGETFRGSQNTLDPNALKLASEGFTDDEGKVLLSETFTRKSLLVEHRKKLLFLPNVNHGHFNGGREVVSRLVTDRKLVQPGQTLHVKGYIMKPVVGEKLSWEPVKVTEPLVSVYPPLGPKGGPFGSEDFPVEVNGKYGTFELKIPVPESAQLQEYSISFSYKSIGQDGEDDARTARTRSGSTQRKGSFIVADPRPPTANLQMDAPFWVAPNSTATIGITAESFIGSSVSDAEITVRWTLLGKETKEGEILAKTDTFGEVEVEIDLSNLEHPASAGDTLRVEASWVGPTRELIQTSKTVRLEIGNGEISFVRSLETDFPGQVFGVKVSLTDLEGAKLRGRPIVLNLKRLVDDMNNDTRLETSATMPLDGDIVQACETQSDSKVFVCRFALPDMGTFALETCTQIEGGKREPDIMLCKRTFLGKTAKEWEKIGPLTHHIEMGFQMLNGDSSRQIGEKQSIGIENPYHDAHAIIIWGSKLGVDQKVFPLEDFAYNQVSVEVDKKCVAGCTVMVTVAVPRQRFGLAVSTKIKVSKLFDLAMPHTTSFSSEIPVDQENSLEVLMKFPDLSRNKDKDFVLAPGDTTQIEVEIKEDLARGAGEEAEVTIVVVDKAILALIPHPLQAIADDFVQDFTGWFARKSSSDYLISPNAIQALVEDFARKKEIDPWFSPILTAKGSGGVDLSREEYLKGRVQTISSFDNFQIGAPRPGPPRPASIPLSFEPQPTEAQKPLILAKAKSATVLGPQQLSDQPTELLEKEVSIRIQKDFVSTALFKSVATDKQVAALNFTAPENLGTYVVRAYATSGTGHFGGVEKEVLVRRSISLTPSVPRFVRVGDTFEAGAILTVPGPSKKGANVLIQVVMEGQRTSKLEILGKDKKRVRIGQGANEEVRFKFKAKSMGEASLRIKADASGGGGDVLVVHFPVEGLQESVTVSSTFTLNGNSSRGWVEGLQLPEAVPGSGELTLTAGVGWLPAILSMAEQIHSQTFWDPELRCPSSASYALALTAIPAITEIYEVQQLNMNSLSPGIAQVLTNLKANMRAGVNLLKEMTSKSIGLAYRAPCPHSNTEQDIVSIHQNAEGIWLMRFIQEQSESSLLKTHAESLKSLEKTWTAALVRELFKKTPERKERLTVDEVAIARWALGGNWTPPPGTNPQTVKDLSMERLSKDFEEMTVRSQAYYIHTRMDMPEGLDHPDIEKAIDIWSSSFRTGGRTAYIAHQPGDSGAADSVGNSLVLWAFDRAGVDNPLVDRLASYVSGPSTGPYGFRSFGDFDKLVAMISLRSYDLLRGSTDPDLKLRVRSGKVNLLKASFQGNNFLMASSGTPWEDLSSPPQPMEFLASGDGEATLAASLSFIPVKLLFFPTYKGIFVQRSIRMEGTSNGPSLKTVPVGAMVEISVQITTPDSLGETTVRILMPAGLEPIDPRVDQQGSFCPVPFTSLGRNFFSYFSCPEQETRPSVVQFVHNSMRPGTHTVSFRAIAATPGEFALPPVKAFVTDEPERMGLSSAGFLTVCTGEECLAEEDAVPEAHKMCPDRCNDNGACNLETGACLCLPGFDGKDCSDFVI